MFFQDCTGSVTELSPNDQTRFQCNLQFTLPLDFLRRMEAGILVAAENVYSETKEKHFTLLEVVHFFPAETQSKTKSTFSIHCTAVPIGIELIDFGGKKGTELHPSDTFPALGAEASILDNDTTMRVIHQIAPESRTEENGSRIDIGTYATHPEVTVGLDASTLLRGNIAVISARPRARATMTNNLITALLGNQGMRQHIVYCDVNNTGTLSLIHLLQKMDHAGILCLNDKFVPSSVYFSLKNPGDRQAHKRAVLDYLDMMILPSVLEQRRHDFVYPLSGLLRNNRFSIYRANELTVDQFINEIRIDILDGVDDDDIIEYITNLMNGIAETYRGERFGEQNTRDIIEMIDEFNQDSKSHVARRTLLDLRSEVQSVYESYSKDIPAAARKTVQDIVNTLNDETKSSLLVVQGQKTTDIMRFMGALLQQLIDERLRRLKIHVPVLFIFNNVDEYVARNGGIMRESGRERFYDTIQTILNSGRRHGIGFCLTLEKAGSLDRDLASKIQTYFVGPITFSNEPAMIAELMNVSEPLIRPAVNYEDGRFLFASADSPYHRRVPLPVSTGRLTDSIHQFLDETTAEQERRRLEFQTLDEERRKKQDAEKRRREDETKKRKETEEEARAHAPQKEKSDEPVEVPAVEEKPVSKELEKPKTKRRTRHKRGTREQPGAPAKETAATTKEVSEPPSLIYESTRSGGYELEDRPSPSTAEAPEETKAAPKKPVRKRPRRAKKKEE